jgi:hypothetical protein
VIEHLPSVHKDGVASSGSKKKSIKTKNWLTSDYFRLRKLIIMLGETDMFGKFDGSLCLILIY